MPQISPMPPIYKMPRLRRVVADFEAQTRKDTGVTATGRGVLSPLAFALEPQKPLASRTRVLTDCSVIPWVVQNPRYVYPADGSSPEVDALGHPRFIRDCDSHAYLVSMGVEMAPMFYNGAFVGAPMWMGKTWDQVAGGRNFDYSLVDSRACNPPRWDICTAFGQILRNPAIYHSAAKPHAPCILDIEQANQNTADPDHMTCDPDASDDVKIAVARNWTNAVLAIKRAAGGNQEVWIHDQLPNMASMLTGGGDGYRVAKQPSAAVAEAWYELVNTFDAATVMHYWWDVLIESPDASLALCAQNAAAVARYAPAFAESGGPRVVVMCPFNCVYFAANDLPGTLAQNNKPVPLAGWKRAVDWYAARGYWIYLWPGDGLVDLIKPHLQYAAAYGNNYTVPPAGV